MRWLLEDEVAEVPWIEEVLSTEQEKSDVAWRIACHTAPLAASGGTTKWSSVD